ncbi:MAG: dephospho-CoA kinase [Oscillospiraceae bacterium]
MKFIGITGGVGAGKSAILDFIREHYRAKVVLADDLAKELMEPGTACHKKLLEAFGGDGVFDETGVMDREKMAVLLFTKPKKRQEMNAIVHPAVKEEILRQVAEEREKGELSYFFLEAALLIEEHYDAICDELWYIYTSEEKRRQRLEQNRGYSPERIERMMASQLPEQVFFEHCAVVIDNNGTPEEAIRQVTEILDGTV